MALDIKTQLDEMSRLEDGWLWGDGKALPPDGIKWLEERLSTYFSDELYVPYLYPTESGGVSAEWDFGVSSRLSLSLKIDLVTHQGYWHALDCADNSWEEQDFDLNQPDSWNKVFGLVKQKRAIITV